jgi:hypothetical protein
MYTYLKLILNWNFFVGNPWVVSFQISAAAGYNMRYTLIPIWTKLIKICSRSTKLIAALDCPELKINTVDGESIRNAAQ